MSSSLSNSSIRALVIGGRGSIGGSMVDILKKAKNCESIVSTSRDAAFVNAPTKSDNVRRFQLDPTCEKSYSDLVKRLQDEQFKPNFIFNAVGMLHQNLNEADKIKPETSFKKISKNSLAASFEANLVTNGLALRYLLGDLCVKKEPGVFGTLSAKVGSISENELGGWYSYRCQKAALNQLIKTAAIEAKRTLPQWTLLSLHPGTVVSSLSDPFMSKAKRAKLLRSVEEYEEYLKTEGEDAYVYWESHVCADKLFQVMINATPEQSSGKLMDYKGKQIPF